MTLRARIVTVVVLVVAAVVLVVGATLQRSTESSLVGEIDQDLRTRARLVTDRPAPRGLPFERLGDLADAEQSRAGRVDPFVNLVGFDALARVLDDDGVVRVVLEAEFDSVVDPALLAAADAGPVLGYGTSEDGRVRVVTAALPTRGYLQLARPLAEVDAVLTDLRSTTLLVGALAIAGAAAVAWVLAGRTVAPIRRLTDATEHVAHTGDLDQPIEPGSARTEVGRLSASFRTMLDSLALSRRQQHQLVMDASHELRTPLTSLRTNVDVLRSVDVLGRGHELAPEARAALVDDLDAELGELAELVSELVDLATDVRDDEPLAPVTLAEVVEPVVERARRRSGRRIDVVAGRVAVLEARPESLGRAVRNLVDNAVKFSPPGTPVRVEIAGGRMTVHDEGPGIPTSARDAVFDRFHRLEVNRSLPGSGLGLAIVKQVVEAHDGTVFVADSPHGGAAVGFTLPTVDH